MKIVKSEEDLLEFDNGLKIEGEGDVDCCANNYLDFENFPVGTEFPDMTLGQLIDTIKLKDDGFILKDSQDTPHWAQARSYQIYTHLCTPRRYGYYSTRTTVYVKDGDKSVTLGELSGDVED